MRILVVSHGFPPEQAAGAELYAARHAQALVERGAEVHVACPGRRAGAPEHRFVLESVSGLPVHRLVQHHRDQWDLRATYDHPAIDRAFDELLEELRPDAVHVHHVAGLSAGVLEVAARRSSRVVVTLHDYWFLCARGQRRMPSGTVCTDQVPRRCARCIRRKRAAYALRHLVGSIRGEHPDTAAQSWASRLVHLPGRLARYAVEQSGTRALERRARTMLEALERAEWLLCPSRELRRAFLAAGLPEERLLHWEYGIDPAPFLPFSAPASREPNAPLRFAFLGSLQPSKGVDLAVNAFAKLPPGLASLDVYGATPPEHQRFVQDLRAHAPEGVRFHGPFAHERVGAILHGVDLLVFPSRWSENAPLTLLESVLAGVPSLVADQGGMREFADLYGTAECFRSGDSSALADALRRFVEDPSAARARAAAPRRKVRTIEDDAAALLELLGPAPARGVPVP